MEKKLDNKVVLLTGASKGLGREMAVYLASEGAKLAICARTRDQLEETAKMCTDAGSEAVPVVCDVSDREQLRNFVSTAAEHFGRIDALINNAAYKYSNAPFLEQTEEDLLNAFSSGLFAVWDSMRLCYPYMKEKGGAIVNILSATYAEAIYGEASSNADKGGIRSLSMAAARDWGRHNIRVNTIAPDLRKTFYENVPEEFNDWVQTRETHFATAAGIEGDPKSVGAAAAFLISDDSQWITGQNITVDGGRCILFI